MAEGEAAVAAHRLPKLARACPAAVAAAEAEVVEAHRRATAATVVQAAAEAAWS